MRPPSAGRTAGTRQRAAARFPEELGRLNPRRTGIEAQEIGRAARAIHWLTGALHE
ncbi:hypothetical protein EMIT0158MI4_130230 [Burkholderia ambifaria]